MERTLETITINNALEVVRLKGELKFKHPLGYTRPSGYCFKHPVKGFFTHCLTLLSEQLKKCVKVVKPQRIFSFYGIKKEMR